MIDLIKAVLIAGLAGFALVAFTPIASLGDPTVQYRVEAVAYPVLGAVVAISLVLLAVMALKGRNRLGEYDDEE
jgi:hypothetical protein